MDLIEKVQDAVVNAGSSYSEDRLAAYENALKLEKELNNENAVWMKRSFHYVMILEFHMS